MKIRIHPHMITYNKQEIWWWDLEATSKEYERIKNYTLLTNHKMLSYFLNNADTVFPFLYFAGDAHKTKLITQYAGESDTIKSYLKAMYNYEFDESVLFHEINTNA